VWRMYGNNAPITLEAKNLPQGVTAEPFTVGPDAKWGTLVVTASADAPFDYRAIEIVGRSEVDGVKQEHRASSGGIVWDTVNTPAISRMSRSTVLSVRSVAPMLVTVEPAAATIKEGDSLEVKFRVQRQGDFTGPVEATGAGYELPRNLQIPLTTLTPDKSEATLKLDTQKVKPGTYSFVIQGAGQVSYKNPAGNAQTTRATFPSNTITLVVEPKPAEAKK